MNRFIRTTPTLGLWLALALVMVGAATTAHAQTNAAQCLATPEPLARLACYDLLHQRDGAAAVPAAVPVAVPVPVPVPVPVQQPLSDPPPAATSSLLGERWDLDGQHRTLFAPRAYKPVYVLPVTWTDRVNDVPSSPARAHTVSAPLNLQHAEAEYQISLKTKLAHEPFGLPVSLWGAYTQSSRWQVYNEANSRPFRETNYEPEVVLAVPLDTPLPGWKLRMATLALNHQSNGTSLPFSRSWNRVIGGLAMERDGWVTEMELWRRVSEPDSDDDNPDVSEHVGRAELRVTHFWGRQSLALQLRHSLRGGERSRGSVQLDYVFPLIDALHGQLQIFSGYGESLIDYNLRQTKVGLGVTIAGWR